MKTNKKDIYGRTYTRFGYCLHIALTVLGFTSFFLLLGYTGSCELETMTLTDYVKVAVPCLAVFGVSILLHNKVFEGGI